MKESLFKKFIEFGFGSIIVLILGFISSPIITRLISPEEFGKMSMFNMITSVISIFILMGLDQAFIRFFYEEKEKNRSKLLIKSIKLPLVLSVILSFIIFIFRSQISNFIVGEYSSSVIGLLITQTIILVISRFSLLSVRMEQKGKLYSVLQILGKLSYIILVLYIFNIKGNIYETLIYALVMSNILVVIVSIVLQKKVWISGLLNKDKTETKFKELIKYGYPLVFTIVITWIFQSIDKISINIFNGYRELGIYSSAFSIIALLNNIQSVFSTFWTPVAFERYKEDSDNREFFSEISKVVSVVFLILSTLIILFKDLIILVLGPEYSSASFVIPFLVFSPIMYTVSETTVLGINFLKKPKLHIYISIMSCITNIVGNIILVPILGAVGAAISTGISYIVFFSMRTILSLRLYKVNYGLKQFYRSTLGLSVLALYMSFNKIDLIGVILGIITLVNIVYAYKKTIEGILHKATKIYIA